MKQGMLALLLSFTLSGCAAEKFFLAPDASSEPTESSELDVSKVMARADQAYQQGDLDSAEKSYRQVIRHSEKNATAQYRLANTLVRLKRYDEAVEAYKATLAQDPDMMPAYNNLALLYMYQAQGVLASGVEHLPASKGDTAQIKHMLWQLKRVTPDKMLDIDSQMKSELNISQTIQSR